MAQVLSAPPPFPVIPDSPYQGMKPFSEQAAPLFFGREVEAAEVIASLQTARLTLLYGASGVGKTSLLQAAIIPSLRHLAPTTQPQNQAQAPATASTVVHFREWRHNPVAGLKHAIAQSMACLAEPYAASSDLSSGTLIDILQTWIGCLHTDGYVLLDQFEEYLLNPDREDDADTFAVEFAQAVRCPNLRVHFLLALREESLAYLDQLRLRIPTLFNHAIHLESLDQQGARAAIEGPLAAYNRLYADAGVQVQLQPALVAEVLGQLEVRTPSPAATPYLQLVMARLWQEEDALCRQWSRPGNAATGPAAFTLRQDTLQRLGGVAGILQDHLMAVMAGLTTGEREVAARIFYHLVTPSGVGARYSRSDLAAYTGLPETELLPVLQRLSGADSRILRLAAPDTSRPADTCYEISHEILGGSISRWQRDFTEQQQEAARAQRRQQERTALEKHLTQARRQGRRALLRLAGLTLLLSCVLSLGIFAWQQRGATLSAYAAASARETDTLELRNQALKDRSHLLAATALLQLPLDPVFSLFLAAEALRTAPTAQAEDTLREVLANSRPIEVAAHEVWLGHTYIITDSTFTPDGQWVVSANIDGTARVWEISDSEIIAEFRGHDGRLLDATFTPDGKSVITINRDGTEEVWDIGTGQNTAWLGGQVGSLQDWDTFTSQALTALQVQADTLRGAAVSPDGKWLVTANATGLVQVWDVRTGSLFQELHGHTGAVTSVQFSPDGKWVVTAGLDATARVWEVRTGQALFKFAGHTASLESAAFSPDGRYIVTASADQTARIWALSTARTIAILRGHTGAVHSAAFSPDGKLVVTAGDDGTALVHACNLCRASATELLSAATAYFKQELTTKERARYQHIIQLQ